MPWFQQGKLVYVDRPPLKTAANEEQKTEAYNNSKSRTQGLYRVLDVSLHPITIDESGIPYTISLGRATPILFSTKHTTINCENTPTSLRTVLGETLWQRIHNSRQQWTMNTSSRKSSGTKQHQKASASESDGMAISPRTTLMSSPLSYRKASLSHIRKAAELARINNNTPGRPRQKIQNAEL